MRRRSKLLAPPLAAVGAAGLLAWQGAQARRTIERLPEADGVEAVHGPVDASPFHLVVVGDSVAAGVGIDHHDRALAGQLAALIAGDHVVRRTVLARSGLTAAGITDLVREHAASTAEGLETADLVVLSVGVNDTKSLHTTPRWRRELDELLTTLTSAAPGADIVLLGVPDMAMFTRLPRPLRSVLGQRSRALDRAGRVLAAARPHVRHLPFRDVQVENENFFGPDGFHPSEQMHAAMARAIHTR